MEQELFTITIDQIRCTGCRICELACSLKRGSQLNKLSSRIRLVRYVCESRVYNSPTLCQNCCDPPCEKMCPTGATHRDPETGLMAVDIDLCIGCKGCVYACPFGACYIDTVTGKAFRCDQCGGEPACVQLCPENVLSLVCNSDLNIQLRRRKRVLLPVSSLDVST